MTLAQNISTELSLEDRKMLWRTKNRSAIREIAQHFELSRTFVDKVYRGEMASAGQRVERELAKRGCPGFTE